MPIKKRPYFRIVIAVGFRNLINSFHVLSQSIQLRTHFSMH